VDIAIATRISGANHAVWPGSAKEPLIHSSFLSSAPCKPFILKDANFQKTNKSAPNRAQAQDFVRLGQFFHFASQCRWETRINSDTQLTPICKSITYVNFVKLYFQNSKHNEMPQKKSQGIFPLGFFATTTESTVVNST
jgi:hypothetical protein